VLDDTILIQVNFVTSVEFEDARTLVWIDCLFEYWML
jgi:hypothetical protein